MTSDKLKSLALLMAVALGAATALAPLADAARGARKPAQGAPAAPGDDFPEEEEFYDDLPNAQPRGTGPAANPFAGAPPAGGKGAGPAFGGGDDFGDEAVDDISDDMLRQKME